MRHAIIMAGGRGTRFWPQSRRALPKQLTAITGTRTLIQETLDRSFAAVPAERTWVVTNRAQAEETSRQLPAVPAGHVLVEPCGRNTAPCIGLAALHCLHDDPDATMIVMPSDHVIAPREAFADAITAAAAAVESSPESLVLFGIPPTYPATGYGYLEQGETAEQGLWQVRSFREKPDLNTAQQFLDSGDYFWNCGIFVWKARTILAEIAAHVPRLHELLLQLQPSIGGDDYDSAVAELFPRMESISIDYAVLEHSPHVKMAAATFDWDDVGSWEALPRLLGTDELGNCLSGLHVGTNTTDCIIRGRPGHLIATGDVTNLVVVQTDTATLIARRGDENALRELVQQIEEAGYDEYL